MRLDKFLKASRLIKRRTVAKELTDGGRAWINGKQAKAASTVKPGDEIAIRFGQKTVVVRVETLKDSPRKEEAGELYTLIREEMHTEADDSVLAERD
jgi:ribosomal 50S subunit-recycling heat shock protein